MSRVFDKRPARCLVVISSGRNGSKAERRSKLLYLPSDLFDEIEAQSQGPLNQVLVELIAMAWGELKASRRQLAK